ncbi:MAG: rhomboid family intramembrane serine protease [Phycisphaerae bacterium]|nr:rhomboid family intramembrane serine protease [Phycisphaerae bacterium]
MFIPIGTDNPLRQKPTVNYILIALNFIIFLYTFGPNPEQGTVLRDGMERFELHPGSPQLFQFITYAFLHASWMHIIGNMLFLYIFGNSVNDKLGHIGYALLYLGGAVFSGMGHALASQSPVLGASGAVAAITGAYMVLFPKTYIHVLYVIFFIGTIEVPAIYFILLKLIIWDNVVPHSFGAGSNIAYSAHLAGYFFGVAIPMGMLAFKLLPHSHYDLWALVQRWRRRAEYNSMVNKGYDPFGNSKVKKQVKSRVTNIQEESPESAEIQRIREKISDAIYQADLGRATDYYLEMLALDNNQILPQQNQLDIANKLMQTAQYEHAAKAYEDFLQHYTRYPFTEQVDLMLGLIYARYLHQNDKAVVCLEKALNKLNDPGQKQMCQDELDRIK